MSEMTSRATARLYTGAGGWGLPSIAADDLSAHALLRFGGIPYSTTAAPSPPNDALVVVIDASDKPSSSSDTAHGLPGLLGLLSSNPALPDPNPNLTPFMTAESTAFATLVTTRFAPARMFEFYVNDANYEDIYHTVLSRSQPFPLNRILPYLARRAICRSFEINGKSPTEVYFDAGIALAALSTRLGERNKYFYGDKPSALDAIVFGQLLPVLTIPLRDSQLRSMIAAHNNLVQFVMRVRREYFPYDPNQNWTTELDPEEIARVRQEGADRRAAEQRRVDAEREAARAARRDARGDNDSSVDEDEEARHERHNKYFLYGAVAVFLAHLLLGSEIDFEVGR